MEKLYEPLHQVNMCHQTYKTLSGSVSLCSLIFLASHFVCEFALHDQEPSLFNLVINPACLPKKNTEAVLLVDIKIKTCFPYPSSRFECYL